MNRLSLPLRKHTLTSAIIIELCFAFSLTQSERAWLCRIDVLTTFYENRGIFNSNVINVTRALRPSTASGGIAKRNGDTRRRWGKKWTEEDIMCNYSGILLVERN